MSDTFDINSMDEPIPYVDSAGVTHYFQPISQRVARKATPEDIEKDEEGITDPNLHRRIATDTTSTYTLTIRSKYSYRTTKLNLHDEESETSEIP